MSNLSKIIISLVLMTLCQGVALAKVDRARVMSLLRGYEWEVPVDRFRQLGEDAYPRLLEIARDTSVPAFIRSRAAAALGLWPNDAVWDFYTERLHGEEPAVVRRRSADALCAAFRDQRTAAVEDLMISLLDAKAAHLRSRAAVCLTRIDTESAASALRAYRQGISQTWEDKVLSGADHD